MSEPTNDLKSACARYPSVPPLLALMYLRSDRRAAGLGALDATRRTGRTIMRYKGATCSIVACSTRCATSCRRAT
jgi:hypothetical protein